MDHTEPLDPERQVPGSPEPLQAPGDDEQGAPPPAPADPPQADPPAPAVSLDDLPGRKLKLPDNLNGWYVVLAAEKPRRGVRARYIEVDCVKASGPGHAKRIVLEEDGRAVKPLDERSPVAQLLLTLAARERRGILLRALPAQYWPSEVDPTTFELQPKLVIG